MNLAIDLFCGLGGWTEGFMSEGYRVIGFDIERHDYGTGGYPGQLVLQDVTTLHGSQFRNAAVIVASPPCQAYSYRAMPWSRAKALPPPDNTLFESCFRIQREANWAVCDCACWRCKTSHCVRCNSYTNTGVYPRYIPLIVENVKGAQKWVGQAAWHFGSFYLWGDVPALMPITMAVKVSGQDWNRYKETGETSPHWRMEGLKVGAAIERRWEDRPVKRLRDATFAWNKSEEFQAMRREGNKNEHNGSWFGSYAEQKERGTISPGRLYGSKSVKRKAASAQIAKIPFPLSQHIAKCFLNPGL